MLILMKKETKKDLEEAVDKLREQRSSELEELRQKKGKESQIASISTLEEESEIELRNHVTELRKNRRAEMEFLRGQSKVKLTNSAAILKENDDKKLADNVSRMNLQREEEMKKIKSQKLAEESSKIPNIFEEKEKIAQRANELDYLRKKTNKSNISFLKQNDEKKIADNVFQMKQNDDKKLADNVSRMKLQREEEMKKIKNQRLAERSSKIPNIFEGKEKIAQRANKQDYLRKKTNKFNISFLKQNDEKKLADSVLQMKLLREDEMKRIKEQMLVERSEKEQ